MQNESDLMKLTVSQTNLAKALNLTARQIRRLIVSGVIVPNPADNNGAVFLFESLQNYFQRKAATTGGDEYFKIKAEHEAVKKQLSERKLQQLEGQLYWAADVEAALADIVVTLRTNLLALPAKFSAMLEGKTKAEIYEILTREIEDKLTEISSVKAEELAQGY